jgi:hypothetical protein
VKDLHRGGDAGTVDGTASSVRFGEHAMTLSATTASKAPKTPRGRGHLRFLGTG